MQLESVSLGRRDQGVAFGLVDLTNWIADVACLWFRRVRRRRPCLGRWAGGRLRRRPRSAPPLMPGRCWWSRRLRYGLVSSGMPLPSAISAMLIYRLISWLLIATNRLEWCSSSCSAPRAPPIPTAIATANRSKPAACHPTAGTPCDDPVRKPHRKVSADPDLRPGGETPPGRRPLPRDCARTRRRSAGGRPAPAHQTDRARAPSRQRAVPGSKDRSAVARKRACDPMRRGIRLEMGLQRCDQPYRTLLQEPRPSHLVGAYISLWV